MFLACKNRLHAVVAHTPVHPDDGLHNLMTGDVSLPVDLHHTAQSKAVHSRIQRADAVGQLPRKHRNHPVAQVDAGSSLQSLPVERRAFRDIMAHIGDVHAQFIAVVQPA